MSQKSEPTGSNLATLLAPVVVGGLIGVFGSLIGAVYGEYRADQRYEKSTEREDHLKIEAQAREDRRIEQVHQQELDRIREERRVGLRGQYVSEFMGQAALCISEARNVGSGPFAVLTPQQFRQDVDKLFTLQEAAGPFLSDKCFELMNEVIEDIRALKVVMNRVHPTVEEMHPWVVKTHDAMKALRVRVRAEVAPSEQSTDGSLEAGQKSGKKAATLR